MSSSFSGLSIANRGLYANQVALNTTSHNISNANTQGYVRQQAMQTDASYIKSGNYKVGTGVGIEEIRQIRSIFIDNMYRNEQSSLSYWQAKKDALDDIQAVMGDLSEDGGIQSCIDEFFDAWEEVSKDCSSGSARASLLEYANSMVEKFNQLEGQLDEMQANYDSQIASMVKDINSISQQIAGLNGKIASCEVNGDAANDYRDEVNSLLDTLSEYVNISVSQDSSGMYNVSIGGACLVRGTSGRALACETDSANGEFNTVVWKETGSKLKLEDGMLLGVIEARGDVVGGSGSTTNGSPMETEDVDADADSYNFTGSGENTIPELRSALNMLVSLMARKVNELHSSGQGLDGSTGVDFFVKLDASLPFEAGNIKVNPELEDTDKIAASSIGGGADDGSVAASIVEFSDAEYFTNDGLKMNIDDFYSKLVAWVGAKGEEASNSVSNHDTLVQQTISKKEALSGVSMDEELANLIKYQNAYNASARLMSIIDSMLETIIERMG